MATVGDIMQKNVITAPPSMTVFEALKIMRRLRIGSIIVVVGHRELGIVTSTDILYKLVLEKKDAQKTKLSDIMSEPLITALPSMTIAAAAQVMAEHNIKKLPVSVDNELVGIITASDIIASKPEYINTLVNLVVNQQEPMGG